MPDRLAAGFTRVTYLDGDQILLPRTAYEGIEAGLTVPTEVNGELVHRTFWKGEDLYGSDVVVRLSEVREVIDVSAAAYAENQAEHLTGGLD